MYSIVTGTSFESNYILFNQSFYITLWCHYGLAGLSMYVYVCVCVCVWVFDFSNRLFHIHTAQMHVHYKRAKDVIKHWSLPLKILYGKYPVVHTNPAHLPRFTAFWSYQSILTTSTLLYKIQKVSDVSSVRSGTLASVIIYFKKMQKKKKKIVYDSSSVFLSWFPVQISKHS